MGWDQLVVPAWNTVRACGFWRKLLSQPKFPLLVPWETTHSEISHTCMLLHRGTLQLITPEMMWGKDLKRVSNREKTVTRKGAKYDVAKTRFHFPLSVVFNESNLLLKSSFFLTKSLLFLADQADYERNREKIFTSFHKALCSLCGSLGEETKKEIRHTITASWQIKTGNQTWILNLMTNIKNKKTFISDIKIYFIL